jgi:hypothetical protein
MALPMNSMPTFHLTIPSSGKKVRFRPFLVKEEKSLLIAQQSEDPKVMVDTLRGVIESCVLDDVDAASLATFDLEYIFLQIRGKSVGETVDLFFQCDNDHGEQNDKARSKITINLADIEVTKTEGHSNKIPLFGDVGVIMKYPTLEVAESMTDFENIEDVFGVVAESIDCIYDSEQVYYAKDTSKQEMLQFLNNLTTEQFLKVQQFFDTMPKLSTTVEYKCPICGKEHKKTLEGLANFF